MSIILWTRQTTQNPKTSQIYFFPVVHIHPIRLGIYLYSKTTKTMTPTYSLISILHENLPLICLIVPIIITVSKTSAPHVGNSILEMNPVRGIPWAYPVAPIYVYPYKPANDTYTCWRNIHIPSLNVYLIYPFALHSIHTVCISKLRGFVWDEAIAVFLENLCILLLRIFSSLYPIILLYMTVPNKIGYPQLFKGSVVKLFWRMLALGLDKMVAKFSASEKTILKWK